MGLGDFKIFNVYPEVKPRVKRLSDGQFLTECSCSLGLEICERYVNFILFNEATEGSIALQSDVIYETYNYWRHLS